MTPARSAARRVCAALAVALVASLVLVVAPPPRPAAAQPASVPEQTWVTNGRVKTMVPGNGRLYLAGYFTQVGPNTGHGGAVDVATGARNPAFPKGDGAVYAAVADGAGGWDLGGSVRTVGSSFRQEACPISP